MFRVSEMNRCLLPVCINTNTQACIRSGDQAEMLCPLGAGLRGGSTAAVANAEVILVASRSLFKGRSSSAGEREKILSLRGAATPNNTTTKTGPIYSRIRSKETAPSNTVYQRAAIVIHSKQNAKKKINQRQKQHDVNMCSVVTVAPVSRK